MTINYDKLPEHMRAVMQRYMEGGLHPGGFLFAVLTNNLMEAFHRADDVNGARLEDYVRFLYWEAPIDSFGSAEKVQAWIKQGGLSGSSEKQAKTAS